MRTKSYSFFYICLAIMTMLSVSCSNDKEDDITSGNNSLIGWWVPADLHSSNWINIFDGWCWENDQEYSYSNHCEIQFGPWEGDSYHFINKNTVEVTQTYLTLDPTSKTFATVNLSSPMDVWTTNSMVGDEYFFTWHNITKHYLNADKIFTYSYVIDDNKIVVSNGTILTINTNGTLIRDGYMYPHNKLK